MTVNVNDVETTVGRTLTATEIAQVMLWIGDARSIISRGRDGHTAVDLDSLNQPILDMIVREAVAVRVKRPNDETEVSVQIDDAQMSRKYESGAGQIEIADRWWDMLLSEAAGAAFSITTSHGA